MEATIPSITDKQARLFRLAAALKSGEKIKAGGAARKIAKTLSKAKIKEFTRTKNG